MDTTYRLRFLLYFAAFMLVMSVCFVYAEPVPSQSHLLFQTSPQHAGFLSSRAEQPSFDPADLRTATAPVISPAMLQRLQEGSHERHLFFRRTRRAIVRSAPALSQSESSILGLNLTPSDIAR